MTVQEYLNSLDIDYEPVYNDENNSYVISLNSSNEFGRIFTKLDNSDDLNLLEDNQVITEQGSSLLYESESEPYLLNLLADFNNGIYELVITEIV